MPKKGEKMSEEQKAKQKATRESNKENKDVKDVKESKYVFKQRVSYQSENFEIGDENKANHEGYDLLKQYCEIK